MLLNKMEDTFSDYLLKYCEEKGILLPIQIKDTTTLLPSAIPYVMQEMLQKKSVTLSIYQFAWDKEIQDRQGQRIFTRDHVNTEEFRDTLAKKLSKKASCFCNVHPLERDTFVETNGHIVRDTAILNATFSRDGPCDDCGKQTKNGRMTCLCWADEEDLSRMNRDAALHR